MDQLNDDEALSLLDNPSDGTSEPKDNGQISKIITMVIIFCIIIFILVLFYLFISFAGFFPSN